MTKTISTVAALSLLTSSLLSPTAGKAENGQIAAGVVGGLIGGALLGSALASRPAMLKSRYAVSSASDFGTDLAGKFVA